MKGIAQLIGLSAALLTLFACTANSTGAPNIQVNDCHNPSFAALQLAVGTARIYGGATPWLNVVSSLRQPNGTSACGVTTPTISGPFTFAIGASVSAGGALSDPYTTIPVGGPSLPETSAAPVVISGTSQLVHVGTPFCDAASAPGGFVSCPPGIPPNDFSFGQSGGVFANGIIPSNSVGSTGQSYSYQPYPQPIYGNADGHPQFIPWGGPPAFDPFGNGMGLRDGTVPTFTDSFGDPVFLGVGEGINAFENVAPTTGTYTLAAQVGTIGSGGAPNITSLTATAGLSSLALLPTETAPVVTPDANLDGGATISVPALPAGVTEEIIQILDWGPGGGPTKSPTHVANCQGPRGPNFAPVYYTVEVTAAGTYPLGTLHGPNINLTGGTNLTPSHSICTLTDNQNPPDGMPPANVGDNITVQMFGFDYPAYEFAVSLLAPVVPQRPTLAGSNGQADITISVPVEEDYPAYTPVPLVVGRHTVRATARHLRSFAAPMLNPDVARRLGVLPRI